MRNGQNIASLIRVDNHGRISNLKAHSTSNGQLIIFVIDVDRPSAVVQIHTDNVTNECGTAMLHGLIGFRYASDDVEFFQILRVALKTSSQNFTFIEEDKQSHTSSVFYHGMIYDCIGVGDGNSIQNLQFIRKFFLEFIQQNRCWEDVIRFFRLFGMVEWLINSNRPISVCETKLIEIIDSREAAHSILHSCSSFKISDSSLWFFVYGTHKS